MSAIDILQENVPESFGVDPVIADAILELADNLRITQVAI